MDPLSRDENYTRRLTPEMWREIKSAPPEVMAEMLDDLKHGNTYYTGVETDKGVLLFSRDIVGEIQYSDYMYKYIENDFFAPEFAVKSLAIHELRGWPSLMEGKVNRCHDRFGWWGDEETIRRAYQDRSVLKNATDSETYDLTPTWENYYRLTDADKGLGLTRSPYNYDRMTLLYIVDKGYPRDGVVDEYPDEFSFHEKFEKIENKQLGRNRWDVYDEMQERAKKLAGKLLKEHFPEIRQKVNRCHDRFGWWGDEETIRRAYQDRSVLKNATDSETYDLTPTWENYYRLTDADKGLGLTRSPYNYDRMTLLYIVDKGYPRDGVVDEYPDEFSFHEKFEKIENKQLGRNRWDVYDEMQERAKKLAGKLLKEHFPEIRQKADMKEKAAVRKSKGMKM